MDKHPGYSDIEMMREAGASDGDIQQYIAHDTAAMVEAGATDQEVEEYWGNTPHDFKPLEKAVKAKINEARTSTDTESPKKVESFIDAVSAGMENSTIGTVFKEGKTDYFMPEDAPMYHRLASQVGMLAGDLPAMLVGGAAGGAAGALATANPIGAAAGSMAGAFALPAYLRSQLIDYYRSGPVRDFSDFWERTGKAFLEGAKQGTVGAVSGGVGGKVGTMLVPGTVNFLTKSAAEVATMTTLGRLVEGETPKPREFVDNLVMILGFHGISKATGMVENTITAKRIKSNLEQIYIETGIKPDEVTHMISQDPVLAQEVIGGKGVPSVFKMAEESKLMDEVRTEMGKFIGNETGAVNLESKPEIQRSEAAKAILSKIKSREESAGPERSKDRFSYLYENLIDNLHPLKEWSDLFEGRKTIEQDPYILARIYKGSANKAHGFLTNATFDYNDPTKITGKSVKQILDPIKEDVPGWEAYAVSRRAIELEGRGIKTGIDLVQAKEVIKEGASKFESVHREMVDYQNRVMDYMVEAGVISKKSAMAMKELHKEYIPFNRILEHTDAGLKIESDIKNPYKQIKGSERDILSPLETVIKNTYSYINLAERNKVFRSTVELAEKNGVVDLFFDRVKQAEKVEVKADEVKKMLKDAGIQETPELLNALTTEEAFNIFRKKKDTGLRDNEIAFFRDGKREVFKVTDENLVRALKTLDPQTSNMVLKIGSAFSTALKFGTTTNPAFAFKNWFRDQLTAGVLSKHGYIPFWDSMKAIGDIIGDKKIYHEWLNSGGANTLFHDLNANYIEKDVLDIQRKTDFKSTTFNILKKPVDFLRVAGELAENSTRLAEFKRAREQGKSLTESAFNAREVTVDFARVGASMRGYSMITAFMNVGVQGTDRAVRGMYERPAKTLTAIAASVTLPSILLWWANKDDKRVQQLPQHERDLNWIIATKDHLYKIPKPQEIGLVFGSGVEHMLDAYFKDNPAALAEFSKTMIDGLLPNYIPTFAAPIAEHITNHSFFTGNRVVTRDVEEMLGHYAYTPYTSEVAKQIGQLTGGIMRLVDKHGEGIPPQIIDNYVRSWSGQMGSYAVQLVDKAIYKTGLVEEPVKPETKLEEYPFIKSFMIRYPSYNAQPIQDFRESYDYARRAGNTPKALIKRGEMELAAEEFNRPEFAMDSFKLQSINEAINNQQHAILQITNIKGMEPAEKTRMIDELTLLMIEEAEAGNKIMDEIYKQFKNKPKE